VIFLTGVTFQARGADPSVAGTVVDAQGNPVAGVQITVKDANGNIVGQAVTDPGGQYTVSNLPAGQYTLTLDPLKTGFQGNTVVAFVGGEGLTVNWTVATNAAAIAAAAPGIVTGGLFGLGTTWTILLGTLGLGGFGAGIAAATGAFDGGSQNVVTDSQ
jgi:hypothetical protein